MKQDHTSPDAHDEGYFASFTDMLVGIIFIFIILLMIVANNYQEATVSITKVTQDLQDARSEARNNARDRARDEIRDKERDATRDELRDEERDFARDKARDAEFDKELDILMAQLKDAQLKIAADSNIVKQPTPAIAAVAAVATVDKINEDLIKQKRIDQRNAFDDSRAKIIIKIKDAMTMLGYNVAAEPENGTLIIPETLLFYGDNGSLNFFGEETIKALANNFAKYLPCITSAPESAPLVECTNLGLEPNNGLDVIFIDTFPNINASKEDNLLLAVQRVVAVFNKIKATEPYLDRGLKNKFGAPVLNIKVNQKRRDANKNKDNNAAHKGAVVIKLIMRKPD